MINVIQNADIYEISFKYDPQLIQYVKNVAGRRWNPIKKIWTIPSENLGRLLKELEGTTYYGSLNVVSQEAINVNESIDVTSDIPDIDITKWKYQIKQGAKPFQHQLDLMRYAVHRYDSGNTSGFLLADDPGAGKTNQIMNLALYRKKYQKYKHCLVITCLNSAKYNWVADIMEHSKGKETPYLLGSRLRRDGTINRDGGSKAKLDDLITGHMYGKKTQPKLPYFIVINIEAIRMKQGRVYPIVEELVKWVNAGKIGMIAIDEVHKNMSPTSMQGKCMLNLKKKTGTQVEWIPMTGTPIVKQPTDVYSPLKLVDGHTFKDYYSWVRQFCIIGDYGALDVIGNKNIGQLKALLQGNMLRRRKEDIFDLPDKIYYTEYVEMSVTQEVLYKRIQEELRTRKAELLTSLNPLNSVLKLRQVTGSPELVDLEMSVGDKYLQHNSKMRRIMELLEEIHQRGEKVIIYSNWVEPLRTLHKFVSKKYKTCVYTGTMSQADRLVQKEQFINDPESTVLIGTIAALGVSHTITVASNVIFLDECLPATKIQAEDRVHRPGTTIPPKIYTLIAVDTVDEILHTKYYNTKVMADYIVDGNLESKSAATARFIEDVLA